jgi:predicted transcriptional regulator
MSLRETPEGVVSPSSGLTWGPAIAGAIAASALAFVLNSFGLAIGLALASTSPTWRDTSFALVLLSGLYLVLAALASYGLGGYIAGRMRRRYDPGEFPEFQDGMHGLLVWGIATLVAGLIAVVTLPLLPRTPGMAAGTPHATSSVPGESLIGFELDRLFRGSERRTGGDLSYDRAEAARILLTTSSHSGMDPADRTYLARLVASDTGTPAPDAERRVDEVAARVKQDISRARSSAVILAFMAGAAALLGAIAAWAAAITAGRFRDGREPVPYLLDWGIESRSRATQPSTPHPPTS